MVSDEGVLLIPSATYFWHKKMKVLKPLLHLRNEGNASPFVNPAGLGAASLAARRVQRFRQLSTNRADTSFPPEE